jgi:hypothetical protein
MRTALISLPARQRAARAAPPSDTSPTARPLHACMSWTPRRCHLAAPVRSSRSRMADHGGGPSPRAVAGVARDRRQDR